MTDGSRVPFDAVLFDLDGTLVATERFWPDAARVGARRAFAELGLERELPTTAEWMGLVGMGLGEGFEALFPDLAPEQRERVAARCVEAEAELLRDGRAALLPGVEETLAELARQGVRTGIASNCHQSYLDSMMHRLGLARWIDEGRCLETPGIADKAAMVEDLLITFGTRRAVMVGDRLSDRDAGWANGLPHVHLARGYAASGEAVAAEAVLDGMDALVPRLRRRDAWIEGVLEALELPRSGAVAIGVTGGPAAGKGLFAEDLAACAGGGAAVVSLGLFARAGEGTPIAEDPFAGRYELELLAGAVLAPHARGEALAIDAPGGPVRVPAGALLVLEGPFLLHPVLRSRLARVVHLAVEDDVAERRVAGRDGRLGGHAPLARLHRELLPLQRAFEELYPPAEGADLVLDAGNALGPP